jgi:hypothetical protein
VWRRPGDEIVMARIRQGESDPGQSETLGAKTIPPPSRKVINDPRQF